MADLVAFLRSLTDERVRRAAAPFDHPQLFVPNGHPGTTGPSGIKRAGRGRSAEIPATGSYGGPVLPGFLETDLAPGAAGPGGQSPFRSALKPSKLWKCRFRPSGHISGRW